MAGTKRSRRSYGAGEWAQNRVRVFPDPKTGLYQLEWRENGRRLTRSLKQRQRPSPRRSRSWCVKLLGRRLRSKQPTSPTS